jgi:integrase
VLHVRRVKNGTPSTHPIQGDELRALRRLQRVSATSPFVFVSERRSPFTTAGFARMIERAAAGAGLELKAHPHMLRHACGYALANKGHDARAIQGWLGHRSITSAAVYTAQAPNRLRDSWRALARVLAEWAYRPDIEPSTAAGIDWLDGTRKDGSCFPGNHGWTR